MKHRILTLFCGLLAGGLLMTACSDAEENGISEEENRLYYQQKQNQVDGESIFETESGLIYEILEEGDGVQPESMESTVQFEIIGRLINNEEFVNSYTANDTALLPIKCIAYQSEVNSGLREGLLLMREGASYELTLPSELAYQNQSPTGSSSDVGATVIYQVELLEVVDNEPSNCEDYMGM